MNRAEFMEMHANCVSAMQTYFVQVEKTSTILAECTAEPLTFRERFTLMSQGIVENDARLAYLGTRSLLLRAAQLGYASGEARMDKLHDLALEVARQIVAPDSEFPELFELARQLQETASQLPAAALKTLSKTRALVRREGARTPPDAMTTPSAWH